MTYLLDTSALGKVYHREAGTPWMHALYEGTGPIFISELAVVEFASMCARYLREGELSQEDLRAMLSMFEDDTVLRYQVLHFTPDVVAEATEILVTHGLSLPLRSLDAIQLAFCRRCPDPDACLITADRRMAALANSFGIRCVDPESPEGNLP